MPMQSINHSPPYELELLTYLQHRTNLSSTQKTQLYNLQKGYEGELRMFEVLKKQLSPNYLLLNNLLLSANNNEFQIDFLLIGKDTIYPLEVKNNNDDFHIQNDSWYVLSSGKEIRNPLHQLKRSEILLGNFLQHSNFHFSIEPYVIFNNPEFHLYNAPLDAPIIFPTQVNRFIDKLNAVTFNLGQHHSDLANHFISNKLNRSSNEKLPEYEYEELRKGIICTNCSSIFSPIPYRKLICKTCGAIEDVDLALKRSIIEFVKLFPDKKITTSHIQHWCGDIISKKTIRRILARNMRMIKKGRHTYYVFK